MGKTMVVSVWLLEALPAVVVKAPWTTVLEELCKNIDVQDYNNDMKFGWNCPPYIGRDMEHLIHSSSSFPITKAPDMHPLHKPGNW